MRDPRFEGFYFHACLAGDPDRLAVWVTAPGTDITLGRERPLRRLRRLRLGKGRDRGRSPWPATAASRHPH